MNMVTLDYICVLEMNPYFVICSSLELKMICAKKVDSGTNEVGAKVLGYVELYFVVFCVWINVFLAMERDLLGGNK